MKTLKLFFLVAVIVFFFFSEKIKAQTVQFELRSRFENVSAWCLNRAIDGEFVYHFTYHLDRRTGKVDRIHWNMVKDEVYDHETGERYNAIDVGNDNGSIGFWTWSDWNNINDLVENQYDVENDWLPLPDNFPVEGSVVGMNFKYIGKGGIKFSVKSMYQLHINENNEVTVNKLVDYADCNED